MGMSRIKTTTTNGAMKQQKRGPITSIRKAGSPEQVFHGMTLP